jgi:SulP family sulfate permease
MKIFHEFLPKSYLYLRKNYSFAFFKKDLIAGITVGIIALPLAMAFGIASGVSPERGIFTAIVAGFLISALGGSRVQIGGPTGAFVVLVYDIMQRTGYEGLALSTLIASVLLVLFALFRLGTWIKFVPYPLITGFTTGLALLIFSSQIKDFFGLKLQSLPADFIDKWDAYFHAFPTFDPTTLGLSIGTLAFILLLRKYYPKIPWGIAAIVVSTIFCFVIGLPVETIQTKFGAIPHSLPTPSLPVFSLPLNRLQEIFMDGAAIAFLGAIESLLSCVIADGMIGGRHKSNCELMGQGIANFASVLFGGIPATGAIARTAANVRNGAETPVAGMIHAATLLFIIVFLAPVVSQIPLASLAAVLMVVAWNMSEAPHFLRLMKAPAGDVAILVAAFFLTVLVDITVAISVGMILASFLFMKRMSDFSKTVPLSSLFRETGSEFPERSDADAISSKTVPEGVEVFEIQGPFFFGAADMLKDLANLKPKVFILRMRHVPMIDASGMHALKEFHKRCEKENISLLLSGVQPPMRDALRRYGLAKQIGEEQIFPHIDAALAKAGMIVK